MRLVLLGLTALPLVASWQVLPGQRVVFKGDSIAKGYAFGNYDDLSPLRTLAGQARILAQSRFADPPDFLVAPTIWKGLHSDGTAVTVDTLSEEVRANVSRGDIRTGDWLIYEDAGELDKFIQPAPWPNHRDIYARYRESLREMILELEGTVSRSRIFLMTMFDYKPRCRWCRWDEPMDATGKTGTDIIRDTGAELGVAVVEMNHVMDRANELLTGRGWGRVVGPDGIHPNVFGNFVMTLSLMGAMGADVAALPLAAIEKRFLHPESGGDVGAVWGFDRDPSDAERMGLLRDLRALVARELRVLRRSAPAAVSSHRFEEILRHGRVLAQPAVQPAGTRLPVSYELGRLYQLDRDHVLLIASLREQGAHDYAVGNDAIVLRNLAGITAAPAVPVNRVEQVGTSVLAKYPAKGRFAPRGALLDTGAAHPAAGTGFLLSTVVNFEKLNRKAHPGARSIEFLQVHWDGKNLSVKRDELDQEPFGTRIRNVGFACIPRDTGFLCPVVTARGIQVIRFDHNGSRWAPSAAGEPFFTEPRELEPSLAEMGGFYYLYTRGQEARGRLYRSSDGFRFRLIVERYNHTTPQVLNQGLDGSLYLTTNTGPGWLRNPLVAYALRGLTFNEPIAIHDEKGISHDKGREVPFVDHGIAVNVLLEGRWRHLLLYRVCDLRETNGRGAPRTPQTGLYLAELTYTATKRPPWRFAE